MTTTNNTLVKKDSAVATLSQSPGNSDIDLSDTCVVYDSLPTIRTLSSSSLPKDHQESTKTCGHVLQLSALVRYLHNNPPSVYVTTTTGTGSATREERPEAARNACPLCQRPIVFICDQLCAVVEDENENIHSSDGETLPMIAFKYGKQTYRLSVQQQDDAIFAKRHTGDNKATATTSIILSWVRPWNFWRSWQGRDSTATDCHARLTTAQDRIIQALQLKEGSLKILHKGKVIYPDQRISARSISTKLIEVSTDDWKRTRKASLVVMGTLLHDYMAMIKEDVPKQRPHRSAYYLSMYLGIGWDICKMIWLATRQTTQRLMIWCYQFAIWRPFLPSSSSGEGRPHHD